MELIEITEEGAPAKAIADLPEVVDHVVRAMTAMYRRRGYQFPWVGYLAFEDGRCVGTCAFKSAPLDNEVEVAYYTFPGYEGRGVATRMLSGLIGIARERDRELVITAQTLPDENASTRILRKTGFAFAGQTDHPEDGTIWEWRLQA